MFLIVALYVVVTPVEDFSVYDPDTPIKPLLSPPLSFRSD